jgi:hypothetical protein
MGGRFWVGMVATIVAIGIAVAISFLVIGAAFVAWGALGALILFAGIVLGIAKWSDSRKQARYDAS